ncbi:MAG: hypothetical protein AB7R40_26045 [Nitrospiraceae bacterium]
MALGLGDAPPHSRFCTALGDMLTEATYQITEAGRPCAESAQRPRKVSAYSVGSIARAEILEPAIQRHNNLHLTATDRSGSEGKKRSNVRFIVMLDGAFFFCFREVFKALQRIRQTTIDLCTYDATEQRCK